MVYTTKQQLASKFLKELEATKCTWKQSSIISAQTDNHKQQMLTSQTIQITHNKASYELKLKLHNLQNQVMLVYKQQIISIELTWLNPFRHYAFHPEKSSKCEKLDL
jgi:hypothetical protein